MSSVETAQRSFSILSLVKRSRENSCMAGGRKCMGLVPSRLSPTSQGTVTSVTVAISSPDLSPPAGTRSMSCSSATLPARWKCVGEGSSGSYQMQTRSGNAGGPHSVDVPGSGAAVMAGTVQDGPSGTMSLTPSVPEVAEAPRKGVLVTKASKRRTPLAVGRKRAKVLRDGLNSSVDSLSLTNHTETESCDADVLDRSRIPDTRHGPVKSVSACDLRARVVRSIPHSRLHSSARNSNFVDMRYEPGVKKFVCRQCDSAFTSNSHLTVHKRIHSGDKPFRCPFPECSAAFSDSSSLRRHKRTHTGARPYVCGVCGDTFTQSSSLNTHRRKHTGDRPYRCNVCQMTFVTSSHLKKHHLVHTGEKPHACHVCGTRFSKANNLKRHLLIHTGDRPFVCRECGDAFTTNGDMKRHVRTHTGEKPFACRFCPAAYNQAGHLRRHELSHAANIRHTPARLTIANDQPLLCEAELREAGEEKRFSCRYCVAVFTQVGHLQRHELKHRKSDPQQAQEEEMLRPRKNKQVKKGVRPLKPTGENPSVETEPETETRADREETDHEGCSSDKLVVHVDPMTTHKEAESTSESRSEGAAGSVAVHKDNGSEENRASSSLHCCGVSRHWDVETDCTAAKTAALPVFPEREILSALP